jgi:hypothetical protein
MSDPQEVSRETNGTAGLAIGPRDSIATDDSNRPADVTGGAGVGRDTFDSAPASLPSTADASSKLATLRRDAVFSFADPGPSGFNFDPEFDRLVSAVEVEMGWRAPPASASFAASDSAENSKSSSVAGA